MIPTPTPALLEHVTCTTCMKEIPLSEAVSPEATGYVAHFCGGECYEKWQKQAGKAHTRNEEPLAPVPR